VCAKDNSHLSVVHETLVHDEREERNLFNHAQYIEILLLAIDICTLDLCKYARHMCHATQILTHEYKITDIDVRHQ
jgi:hypothetical protein